MNQKTRDHIVEGNTSLFGLPLGCGKGNYNVTEELWRNVSKLPLTHGKGKNIGRTSAVSELLVERSHLLIIHQDNAQFALMTCQGA